MSIGAVVGGHAAQAEVQAAEHVGVDTQLAGDHQPRRERPGLADGVEAPVLVMRSKPPARSSLVQKDFAACTVERPVRRPTAVMATR